MKVLWCTLVFAFLFLALPCHAFALGEPVKSGGVHLPMFKTEVARKEKVLQARSGGVASIGIGDYLDV